MKIQFQALNRQSADHISRVCWRTDHNQILQTHFKSGLKVQLLVHYLSTTRLFSFFLTHAFACPKHPQSSNHNETVMFRRQTMVKNLQLNSLHQVGFRKHPNCTQFFAPSWVPQTSELHSVLCTKLGSANIRTAVCHLHVPQKKKKIIRADIVSLADFKRSSTEVPRSSHPYTPFHLDLLQLLLVQGVNLQCSRVGYLWHLRQKMACLTLLSGLKLPKPFWDHPSWKSSAARKKNSFASSHFALTSTS